MSKNKSNKSKGMTRRHFLRTMGGCAAMSQTAMLSTLMNLSLTQSAAAAADTSGYKAMVCVFLFGGNDSYNMLVPTNGGEPSGPYDDYVTARGTLALDQNLLHHIDDPVDGRSYGLHPGMAELQELYLGEKLAFIPNVGSLIEPVDLGNYRNGALLPLGLFSHSDQQRHWQTATPQSRTQITGWLGRVADVMNDAANRNPAISMNIALERLNILQTGNTTSPYVVDDRNGATVLSGYGLNNAIDSILTQATDSYLDQSYQDLLKQTHANSRRQSINAAVGYNDATASVLPDPPDPNSDPSSWSDIERNLNTLQRSSLGRQLLQAAKAIGARSTLDQDRQVFFTSRGGFDNHTNLVAAQASSLPDVSRSLKAFYDVTVYLGVENDVVTFTASDFSRTLNPNSNNGSDHAWGGNHIVMGGSVAGGSLYGSYPDSLAPGNALDLGRGRLIPTTSVDQYMAELAMWFGIGNDATLETILPNIRNFYSSTDANQPLGFMDMPV